MNARPEKQRPMNRAGTARSPIDGALFGRPGNSSPTGKSGETNDRVGMAGGKNPCRLFLWPLDARRA